MMTDLIPEAAPKIYRPDEYLSKLIRDGASEERIRHEMGDAFPLMAGAGWWDDNNARIQGNGNLSLGSGGVDDGAYDTTNTYAKNDVWIDIPVETLAAALPTTNLTEAVARAAAGLWTRTFLATNTVDSFTIVNLSKYLNRTFQQISPQGVAPHGIKVLNVVMSYSVGTLAATAISAVFRTETPQSNNTARAIASTTPLGAVTYQNPIGTTVATLPVATQANPYVTEIVPGTPIFVTTDRQRLTMEIEWSMPNTTLITLTELVLHCSYALY